MYPLNKQIFSYSAEEFLLYHSIYHKFIENMPGLSHNSVVLISFLNSGLSKSLTLTELVSNFDKHPSNISIFKISYTSSFLKAYGSHMQNGFSYIVGYTFNG